MHGCDVMIKGAALAPFVLNGAHPNLLTELGTIILVNALTRVYAGLSEAISTCTCVGSIGVGTVGIDVTRGVCTLIYV